MTSTQVEMTGTQVELEISGMTCTSCAARVERRLNRLDGVSATVNYATETAVVRGPEAVHTDQLITDLIAEVRQSGYHARLLSHEVSHEVAHEDASEQAHRSELISLRRRLILSATLSALVIAMAMIPALQFPFWQWASLALATPVVAWGAWPFHRAAAINLRHGAATMDTLVSLGVSAAYLWSVYALVFGTAGQPGMTHTVSWTAGGGDGAIYFEVATAVTTFVLAGRFVEVRARRQAGAALRALLTLGATEVTVLRDGHEVRMPVAALAIGDRFVARPGEKIGTDATVESGSSSVDASLITGESVPVSVSTGSEVIGGTINVDGHLVLVATRIGADTQLAQITRLVQQAQARKARVQRLVDRISAVFVPIVIAGAILTLAVWLLLGGPVAAAINAAVAVLIIACPCALGLATPTALMVGMGRGASLGILIRGPEVLESSRTLDTIVLDKTGTVTTGQMTVAEVVTAPGIMPEQLLRMAGALESASEHPIAQAIVRAASASDSDASPVPGPALDPVQEFRNHAGFGVSGRVAGHDVLVGTEALLQSRGIAVPEDLLGTGAQASTIVWVAWAGQARGALAVTDAVRPGSASAVAQLKRLGLTPILLTGDRDEVAREVAARVRIDQVHAGRLPEQKVRTIIDLQAAGHVVAMVGDGVNDAAALAQADLGIAMGTGTDAAIEAADITLVSGDLHAAVDAIRLSRRTLGTIKANLFWAFAYNVAALPLAALGLLNPMIAGLAMSASSVFVVGNSLRLRRFRRSTASRSRTEGAS